MVFVFTVLIIILLILLLNIFFNRMGIQTINIIELPIKIESILFFGLNVLFIIFSTIAINHNIVFFFIFLVFVIFLQLFVWHAIIGCYFSTLIDLFRCLSLIERSHNNLFLYSFLKLKNKVRILCIVLYDLGQDILSTVYDIKFFISNINREVIKNFIIKSLTVLRDLILKYIDIITKKDYFSNKTDRELSDLQQKLESLRDPHIFFNLVRRLPLFFNYNYISFTKNLLLKHLIVVYKFLKSTILALIGSMLYFFYTIFFFKIQFLKQLAVWFVIGLIFFWLISGFNFFLKRYQFGKFTSQIQRFWKRTNTYFWLIEGFLLLIFFYYYLNSSQEPLYMYDYSSLNQEYLISLYTVALNIVLLSIIIYFMYFVLLRINLNSWEQLSFYLIVISVFIFFSFFIETYQFYYVISIFNERVWLFNEDENLWLIETDNPVLRTKMQYFLVCLIAKYWHFLFIFLSWVFFLIKSFERKKITFVLFGANLQNIIILFALNFACYVQWFKWFFRRFFDLPYTWFFLNPDNKLLHNLVFEFQLLFINLFSYNVKVDNFSIIIYKSLTLWNVDSLCMWKFI